MARPGTCATNSSRTASHNGDRRSKCRLLFRSHIRQGDHAERLDDARTAIGAWSQGADADLCGPCVEALEVTGASVSVLTGTVTTATLCATDPVVARIDELLTRTSSKYGLAIYAAKRARQINDYYAQLGEGLLEYVGPLVEPLPKEKPLSIALREINAGLLEHTEGE